MSAGPGARFGARPRALLGDFGLARSVNEPLDPYNDAFGRLVYRAPELDLGDGARTLATDVFALGMLVVELWSGRRPFARADSDVEALLRQSEGERPHRDEITRDDFPERLWSLAEDCWKQDAKERQDMTKVYSLLTSLRPRPRL